MRVALWYFCVYFICWLWPIYLNSWSPNELQAAAWKRFIYSHLLTKVEIPFLVSLIENQKTERIPWCFYFTRASTVALVLEIGNHFPIRKLHSKISRNWPQGTFLPVLSLCSKTPPVGIKTIRPKPFSPRMFYSSRCICSSEMGFTVECYFAEIGRVNVIPCSVNKHYSM